MVSMPPTTKPLTELDEIASFIPSPEDDKDHEILNALQASPRGSVFGSDVLEEKYMEIADLNIEGYPDVRISHQLGPLQDDIAEQGQLVPVDVSPTMVLLHGLRRVLALQRMNQKCVLVRVCPVERESYLLWRLEQSEHNFEDRFKMPSSEPSESGSYHIPDFTD
jgi:hypothetical protein